MERWIEIAPGIRVTGDGAAWLPDLGTLVVADVHIGYELAAQRRGGYLPPVARGETVGRRVARMAEQAGARVVVIAGDLRHSTRDVDDLERAELADFARAVTSVAALRVVLGNHDRDGALVDDPSVDSSSRLTVGDVDVVHHPPATTPHRWTICGHLHPRVTVRDETGAASRFASALVGERLLVLPALSDWAGGTEATRLMPQLPAGPWRVLPMVGGAIADLGIVLTAAPP